jgi:hypothetical protein
MTEQSKANKKGVMALLPIAAFIIGGIFIPLLIGKLASFSATHGGHNKPINPSTHQLIAYLSYPHDLEYWSWSFNELLKICDEADVHDIIEESINNEYLGLSWTLNGKIYPEFIVDDSSLLNTFRRNTINQKYYLPLKYRALFIKYRCKGESFNVFHIYFEDLETNPLVEPIIIEILEQKLNSSDDIVYLNYIKDNLDSSNPGVQRVSKIAFSILNE